MLTSCYPYLSLSHWQTSYRDINYKDNMRKLMLVGLFFFGGAIAAKVLEVPINLGKCHNTSENFERPASSLYLKVWNCQRIYYMHLFERNSVTKRLRHQPFNFFHPPGRRDLSFYTRRSTSVLAPSHTRTVAYLYHSAGRDGEGSAQPGSSPSKGKSCGAHLQKRMQHFRPFIGAKSS